MGQAPVSWLAAHKHTCTSTTNRPPKQIRLDTPTGNPVWCPTKASNSFERAAYLPVKRILIADDHESVLRRIRGMIGSQPGWEVCGDAVTGREAVTKAAELKPDLVVLDFAMPHMDGLKAASAIKAVLPRIPIVMFTMYSAAVAHEAERHGITRLIDKAKSGALVRAIEELLGTQEQEVEQDAQNTLPPPMLDAPPKTEIIVPANRKAS